MFRELLIYELPVNLLVAALALGFFRLCVGVWRQLFKGSWVILGLLALYMSILYALTGIPSGSLHRNGFPAAALRGAFCVGSAYFAAA